MFLRFLRKGKHIPQKLYKNHTYIIERLICFCDHLHLISIQVLDELTVSNIFIINIFHRNICPRNVVLIFTTHQAENEEIVYDYAKLIL